MQSCVIHVECLEKRENRPICFLKVTYDDFLDCFQWFHSEYRREHQNNLSTNHSSARVHHDNCSLPVKISDFSLSFFNDVFAKTYKEKNTIIQSTTFFSTYRDVVKEHNHVRY